MKCARWSVICTRPASIAAEVESKWDPGPGGFGGGLGVVVVVGDEDVSWRLRFRGGGLMVQSWLRLLMNGFGRRDGGLLPVGGESSEVDMIAGVLLLLVHVTDKVESMWVM